MTKERLLITGANGFTGLHACHHFQKMGYEVIAVSRSLPLRTKDERLWVEQCDLTDKHQVNAMIQKTAPDKILHLAGQNQVQESWLNPTTSIEANVLSTVYLLEAIRQTNPLCKIVIVGSALQFNLSNITSIPHPYSLSKSIQVLLAQSWETLYGMNIVIAKPSNLIGPGESNGVCSILAKKVAEMERFEVDNMLTVNNLSAQRDFIDVRDAVRAYEKLFDKGISGDSYEISSGKMKRLKDVIDTLQKYTLVDLEVQSLEDKKEKIQVMTPKKLLSAGWAPLISFDKSIQDLLNYHRKNLL